MGLGDRFRQWLGLLSPIAWLNGYFKRVQDRWNAEKGYLTEATKDFRWIYSPVYQFRVVWYIIGTILLNYNLDRPTQSGLFSGLTPADLLQIAEDPQAWVQKELHKAGTSNAAKAFAEFVGTIITEPVVSLLEQYSSEDNPDPHAMARAFHGIASGLPWAANTVDNLLKIPLGDRAPKVGESIMHLYWGLGLGFLGWQTLAPLLSAGLQPNLQRYYNKLYRPERFTPSQVRDIFALGLWNADQLKFYLQEQGWRDEDIKTWLAVSYRDFNEGQLWELYHRGLMSQSEIQKRLRKLGYNPDDIPLLFKVNEKEDTEDAPKYLLSTAKNALKNHRIGQDEFRTILRGLKYAEREIELQISLITSQKQEEDRDLNTGQIRQLYEARIIGKDEAIHNLTQLRYRPDVAQDLIVLWDSEALPKAARINKSTILEGYVNGALSRDESKNLLIKESGYSEANAELILKIEEASLKKSEQVALTEGRAISITLLTDLAQNNLINRAELEQRAELARFTPEDRARIIELMLQAPITQQALLGPDVLYEAFKRGIISQDALRSRLISIGLSANDADLFIAAGQEQLSTSLLSSAYTYGVISRADFASRLRGAGLEEQDIEILIRTVELDNPDVFGEFTGQFIKRPSVGSLQLALQRGLIDESGFRARLSEQGYSQDAIEIYLFNAQYQVPVQPKQLTKADILSLYTSQKFSRSQALQRLVQIGYTIEDATLLVEQKAVNIEDTEIGQAYINGLIDQFGAASALTDLGFTVDEIDAFFNSFV